MTPPRVSFRAFLLGFTLLSLLTAWIALQSRTTRQYLIQDHIEGAYRARNIAELYGEQARLLRKEIEQESPITGAWAQGCELRLNPMVHSTPSMLVQGHNLIVLAENEPVAWLRIFDDRGRIIADQAVGWSPQDKDFLKTIKPLFPPYSLNGEEKARIIDYLLRSVDAQRVWIRQNLKNLETSLATATAEAEAHEALVQGP